MSKRPLKYEDYSERSRRRIRRNRAESPDLSTDSSDSNYHELNDENSPRPRFADEKKNDKGFF